MLDLNWSPKKTTKTKAQDAENLPQQRSQVQKQKATGQLPMKGNVDDGVEKKIGSLPKSGIMQLEMNKIDTLNLEDVKVSQKWEEQVRHAEPVNHNMDSNTRKTTFLKNIRRLD